MKKALKLSNLFIFIISLNGYCQERKNETREKIDFVVESKSDKISNVAGWTNVEKKGEKIWEQSNPSMQYNYQINRPHKYAFKELKIFQLSSKGKKFYALSVSRPIDKIPFNQNDPSAISDTISSIGTRVEYFFFTEPSLKRLQNIVNEADGKSHQSTTVKYYKTGITNQNLYDNDISVKNKEIQAILNTSKGSIENHGNLCEGDSLFVINSQILNGNPIVRFNLLSNVSGNSNHKFKVLPVSNSYFELTKMEFNKLFQFTPYITKENLQKASTLINSGMDKDKKKDYTGAISEYSKALDIDPDNADTYSKRALSKKELKDNSGAIDDFSKAIAIDSKGSYYYSKALIEIESGQKNNACLDLNTAIKLGYKKAEKTIKENCL
jgi:hypothetical protein